MIFIPPPSRLKLVWSRQSFIVRKIVGLAALFMVLLPLSVGAEPSEGTNSAMMSEREQAERIKQRAASEYQRQYHGANPAQLEYSNFGAWGASTESVSTSEVSDALHSQDKAIEAVKANVTRLAREGKERDPAQTSATSSSVSPQINLVPPVPPPFVENAAKVGAGQAGTIEQLKDLAAVKYNAMKIYYNGKKNPAQAEPAAAAVVPQNQSVVSGSKLLQSGLADSVPSPASLTSSSPVVVPVAPTTTPKPDISLAADQLKPSLSQDSLLKEASEVSAPPVPPKPSDVATLLSVASNNKTEKSSKADAAPAPAAAPVAHVDVGTPTTKTAETKAQVEVPSKSDLTQNIFTKRSLEEVDAQSAADSAFIRDLTGNGGMVTLNVAGAAVQADIQDAIHLDEAVAFALRNNFEVRASEEKTLGAYWDKMGAYAQFVPSVRFSYATGEERSLPAAYNDANGDRVLDDIHRRHDRSVTVRQPLIDLGIIADILSTHDKEDIAKTEHRDVREGIASDTVTAFYKLVQARVAIQLADQYKRYLDDLTTRMGARVEGGGGAKADMERVKGRATTAESARVEALGDYETNLSEFKRLTKVMPTQLKIPDVLAPGVPADLQKAMEIALRSNPSYQSSLKKIDTAADDRNKTISGMLPKLSLQYNRDYSYNAAGLAKSNPTDGVYPTQTTQSFMVVAQWSLESGTPITSTMASAAKEREMRLKSDDVRARLEQGLRAGFTAINAAAQRETILRKAVDADEKVVKAFEDQYKDGGRSLFDLLDAYEQLYNARLNLMRVIIAKTQALYQLRKQMGDLIPSVMGVAKG